MKILEIITEPSKIYVNTKFTLKFKVEPSIYRLKKFIMTEDENSIITENSKKIITEWSEKNE